MEDKLNNAFSLLGFTKNEKIVFFDLIKYGKSRALEISKRTGMHRTNIYDVIRHLIDKGVVFEVVENETKLFLARSPEKMIDYVHEIEQEFLSVIPDLKNMSAQESNEESITLGKGVFAIREALTSLIELKSPINIYGATKDVPESFGIGFLDTFHKKRIAKEIMMKHIYYFDAPERIKKLNKLKYTEAKKLPEKFYSAISTAICKDIVLMFIFTHPISVIKIKNKAIAESYEQYFQILWSKANND